MWTFYSVEILKCEFFSVALRRNSRKWIFLLVKIFNYRPFLSLSVETLKVDIFVA